MGVLLVLGGLVGLGALVVFVLVELFAWIASRSDGVQRSVRKWEARPDKTFMEQVRDEYQERRKGK